MQMTSIKHNSLIHTTWDRKVDLHKKVKGSPPYNNLNLKAKPKIYLGLICCLFGPLGGRRTKSSDWKLVLDLSPASDYMGLKMFTRPQNYMTNGKRKKSAYLGIYGLVLRNKSKFLIELITIIQRQACI